MRDFPPGLTTNTSLSQFGTTFKDLQAECFISFDRHGFNQHPSLLSLHMSNVNSVSKKQNTQNILTKNPEIASKDRHFETRSLYVHVYEESWGRRATSRFSFASSCILVPRGLAPFIVSTKGRDSWC